MKRIISIFLIGVLTLSTTLGVANAQEAVLKIDEGLVTIKALSGDSILIKSDKDSSMVTTTRDMAKGQIKTTVTDLNTKQTYYFTRDEKANTIYSSLTGKTTSLRDIVSAEAKSESTLRSSTKYKYVSYRTILRNLGTAVTVAGLIGLIITLFGGGIPMIVLSITGGVVSSILWYAKKGAIDKHGIKIKVMTQTVKKWQGGKFLQIKVRTGVFSGFY